MDYIYIVHCFVIFLPITFTVLLQHLTTSESPLTFLQPIRHEARFNYFNLTVNKMYGHSIANEIVEYSSTQYLNFHYILKKKAIVDHVIFEAIECKEYYIDCVNVRTFELTNMCNNMKTLTMFVKFRYQKQEAKCPLEGEYVYINTSLDFGKIAPIFVSSINNLWERTLKMSAHLYDPNNELILGCTLHNYFLSFRNKKRIGNKNINYKLN
ncbi:uncharacterized protein LOC126839235 [Adelges cooleyi]|uniref:uncharacterized protein LOC126839235 n=1 Tax=Adelges cooleyi TaxID=133065 RepID=UPI00217F9314|nr:uncharacterized protein LOC126839235 [Adelges cooleyi]